MADINSIIDQLSPEELDLLNSDPQMLAAFKAKHAPGYRDSEGDPNDPSSFAFQKPGGAYPNEWQTGQDNLTAIMAPGMIKGGVQAVTKAPELLAGIGRAASKGLGAFKAPFAKGAAKVGDILAPSVEKADAALMEKLAQHGLKDVKPTVFNANERDAIVNYAETMKKMSEASKLDPRKLQEVRATLKDVLDNRLIAKASPTGQTVSKAKDAATQSLKEKVPDLGKSLDTLKRAYEAQGTKDLVKGMAKKAIMAGLAGTAAGLGFKMGN